MVSIVVDAGVEIPAADGMRLVADVLRPVGPGRNPTVLMRTPYDRGSSASVSLQVHALRLAATGYAVVLQDVRGRGSSAGQFEPFVDEQADGVATLEWIASQPWARGDVAMAGISYNAFAQLAAATAAPEPLKAWLPGLTPFDVRTSWIREGGALNHGFHLAWGLGSLLPADRRTRHRAAVEAAFGAPWTTAARGPEAQPELEQEPGAWYRRWVTADDPYPSDPRVPGLAEVSAVEAPALVLAGWYDLFQPGSFALYEALVARTGASHHLVAGPWGHQGLPLQRRTGDADHGMAAAVDLHDLQVRWFDHHLRGADEPSARIRVFVTGGEGWTDLGAWPPPATSTSWHLTSRRSLDPVPPAPGELVVRFDRDDPTPSFGGRVFPWEPDLRPGRFEQSGWMARKDVLAAVSEPLGSPLLALGPGDVDVAVSVDAEGTDVVAVLLDVAPDGRCWNIADGVARLPAVGGTTMAVKVRLGHLAHRFGPGHRVGLGLSAAAFPRFDLPFGSGPRRFHLGADGVALHLPVVES